MGYYYLLPPPDNWKRPPGRPRITWLNTVQRSLRAYNLTLNETVDLAQNRPLCRLMSTYGATHSQWCMPEQKNRQVESTCVAQSVDVCSDGDAGDVDV